MYKFIRCKYYISGYHGYYLSAGDFIGFGPNHEPAVLGYNYQKNGKAIPAENRDTVPVITIEHGFYHYHDVHPEDIVFDENDEELKQLNDDDFGDDSYINRIIRDTIDRLKAEKMIE